MDLGLKGKVAIVTGGSEGIGRATAILFAQEGASVAIGARRQGPLDEAQAAVEAAGGDCLAMSMDVTSDDDCERLVAATIERFGGVDILINNAGQSSSGMIESHDIETWAVDLDLKLYGAIRLAKLCAPSMRERGGGRIVNLLNIGCKTPGAGSMPTAASRAAGLAMTKALSKEVAADQILVNAACIGSVDSAQWHGFHRGADARRDVPRIPRQRRRTDSGQADRHLRGGSQHDRLPRLGSGQFHLRLRDQH